MSGKILCHSLKVHQVFFANLWHDHFPLQCTISRLDQTSIADYALWDKWAQVHFLFAHHECLAWKWQLHWSESHNETLGWALSVFSEVQSCSRNIVKPLLNHSRTNLMVVWMMSLQGRRRKVQQVSLRALVKAWWAWSLDRQAASWTWPAAPSRASRGNLPFLLSFNLSCRIVSLWVCLLVVKNFLCCLCASRVLLCSSCLLTNFHIFCFFFCLVLLFPGVWFFLFLVVFMCEYFTLTTLKLSSPITLKSVISCLLV